MREVGLLTEDGAVKDQEGWKNLGRFFVTRKWWHRMWTVQEYVPEVKKLFMCGDRVFTPDWIQNTSDPALEIDYSLSDETVFNNVAEYFLRTMHGLDWLEAVMPSREHKYPSWVPDWGRSGVLAPQPIPKAARDASGDYKVYNPWGSRVIDGEAPRIVRGGRRAELLVTGILFDEITCLYDNNKSEDTVVIRSWIERACKELGDGPYPHTGETVLLAALRTITLDVAPVDIDIFARQQDNLDDLVNLPVGDVLVKLMCTDPSMDIEAGILREMRREMTKWRRFAITRRGFIGLVPFHSRVADKGFAFSGGSVLYVARELAGLSQTRYTYVGESYSHGLMDGEWRENDAFGGPARVVLV